VKYAIWVPWLKDFFRHGSTVWILPSEEAAQAWVNNVNYMMTPCGHPAPCKTCRYKVVPWDDQAQAIASGKVLP
jgi:hypothetical protein